MALFCLWGTAHWPVSDGVSHLVYALCPLAPSVLLLKEELCKKDNFTQR